MDRNVMKRAAFVVERLKMNGHVILASGDNFPEALAIDVFHKNTVQCVVPCKPILP